MSLKRGLFRTAVVAAILLFTVGVVHRLLTEVLATLIGEPLWLRGITGIFVACGVVLAAVLLLPLIFPGSLTGVFRWVTQSSKQPPA